MSDDHIQAEPRTEFGKGAARRIRRDAKVPAVIYGHGNEPIHITLPGHDTMMALKNGGGANALLYLMIDGKEQLALTKQIQADPIKGFLEHLDFVAVRKGEKVTVDVQVQLVGDPHPDALIVTENNTVSIEVDATNIPEQIEVSIEGAEVGTYIYASDLVLPAGSELLTDPEIMIVNVTHAPTAEEVESELEEAEAEAGIERDETDEEAAAAAESDDSSGDDAEGGSSDEDSSSDD